MTARNDHPSPPFADPADRVAELAKRCQPLAKAATVQAIAAYHAAKRAMWGAEDEYEAAAEGLVPDMRGTTVNDPSDPAFDEFLFWARQKSAPITNASAAETALVQAILSWDRSTLPLGAENLAKEADQPRAIVHKGVLYIAADYGESDLQVRPGAEMSPPTLHTIPLGNVVDLDNLVSAAPAENGETPAASPARAANYNGGRLDMDRERQSAPAAPFVAMDREHEFARTPSNRTTVEEFLADEVEDFPSTDDGFDRAIWRGTDLIAVIRKGPDGKPLVTRFGDPDPADFATLDGNIQSEHDTAVLISKAMDAVSEESRDRLATWVARRYGGFTN